MAENRQIIRLASEDVVRALQRATAFEDVAEEELRRIAERAHVLSFFDGETIVPAGEEGLGFYVVLTGAVRIVRDGRAVACLHSGQFFGEISLIEGQPRNATVIADGPTVCLGVIRADFKRFLVRNPRLALRILDEIARREETSV